MAKLTIQLKNELDVLDGAETVSVLNKSETFVDMTNFSRNKDSYLPNTTWNLFDYSWVALPKYLKLVTDSEVTIHIGWATIENVTFLELKWTIPMDITIDNLNTSASVNIDYLLTE